MEKKTFIKRLFVTAFSVATILGVSNTALADGSEEIDDNEISNDQLDQEINFESYDYALKPLMESSQSEQSMSTLVETQMEAQMEAQAASDGKPYAYGKYTGVNFSRYSFKTSKWVRGGATFKNLACIDMENSSGQSLEVRVYDSTGKYYGKGVTAKGSGWRSVNFESAGILPKGKSYKIKLVNLGSGTVSLKQGTVLYNY